MYTRVTTFHGRDSLCIYAVLGAAYLGRCFGELQSVCTYTCGPICPDLAAPRGIGQIEMNSQELRINGQLGMGRARPGTTAFMT